MNMTSLKEILEEDKKRKLARLLGYYGCRVRLLCDYCLPTVNTGEIGRVIEDERKEWYPFPYLHVRWSRGREHKIYDVDVEVV